MRRLYLLINQITSFVLMNKFIKLNKYHAEQLVNYLHERLIIY